MDVSPSPSLIVPLSRPARGGGTRVQLGAAEIVLESVRGGHTLLWSDGRQARRYTLGLADEGQLTLQLKAPRLPVRVVPRDVLAVVPGGRLRGYVQVPLVPTLMWHDALGRGHALIELQPGELQAEWDDVVGHSFQSPSAWHVRFPMRNGEPRAVVPIRLVNQSAAVLSPGHLAIALSDDELTPLRGSIVAAPRRLRWLGDRFAEAPVVARRVEAGT